MSARLWYPQLDVYDSIRRMVCILRDWTREPISAERLFILDFFMASPAILHTVNMTQEIRNRFQALRIAPADKGFLSYPVAPVLFSKMEEIQKSAIRTLAGKGLIIQEHLANNLVVLSEQGRLLAESQFKSLATEGEKPLLEFLTQSFGTIGLKDIRELRRRTGLRRAVQ